MILLDFKIQVNIKNTFELQMHVSRGVFGKRFSENMQQIYRSTPMLKCGFSKVAKQLY